MFELTAGTIDRPFRDAHPTATVLSVASHVLVLGSVVGAIMFAVSDTLPEVPSMMAFVTVAPAPPPPPPPPPPPARAAQAPDEPRPARPIQTTEPVFMAPAEIPVGITPEAGLTMGDEGGEVGGVEGGLPGGVPGGVPGGIVTDVAPPPPPPPPQRPARVGGDIKAPALVHRVEPIYPPIAVSAKVTGMVILEATVSAEGQVTDVTVLRSVPLLDKAAIAAVRQWRYEPLVLNGRPSPFVLTVTLTFSIRNK
jgi:protein TonB